MKSGAKVQKKKYMCKFFFYFRGKKYSFLAFLAKKL